MRQSGILMHITSLPGPDGIGSLGKEAYEFADFLHAANMGIWQVLPMGPTGYGESPYQSTSVFAGNPLFISLDKLEVNEMMGSELHLHVYTSDETRLIVRVPTINLTAEQRKAMVYGAQLYITFEGKVMHFFDKESTKNLIYGD